MTIRSKLNQFIFIKYSRAFRVPVVSFLLFCSLLSKAEVPLVFISAPDPSFCDKFLESPIDTVWQKDLNFFLDSMAQFHPAFTLFAGDLGGQHWWDPNFRAICAPGGSLRDVIFGCADKSWGAFKTRLNEKGLKPFYVAVGDHDIGDNDWPLGDRSLAVTYFKEAFAKHFTTNPDGTSMFTGNIGGVPMRPVGTPYQGTSYAVRVGNLLVVSIDQFRQQNPNLNISRRGTVDVRVSILDGHLQWLDNLLSAARLDSSIKFIIVQGHTPVISPVRTALSSNIFHEDFGSSNFWNVLRKHKVDLYFAGEVHRNTVDRDITPDLIQVAHTGAPKYGFLVGRVYSKSINLEVYRYTVGLNGTASYIKDSTLVIDKSLPVPKLSIIGGETLRPIDRSGLQIHYSFDGDISKSVVNRTAFGADYNATNTNVKQISDGKLDAAAWFDGNVNTMISAWGVSPFVGNISRTFSVWIRTIPRLEPRFLWLSGRFIPPALPVNLNPLFRPFMNQDGKLGLLTDESTSIVANQGALRLDDRQWHHVGIVFPGGNQAILDDVRFYIDGNLYLPSTHIFEPLFTRSDVDFIEVGGSRDNMNGWAGGMDDFAIWNSTLIPSMMKALFNCAGVLNYNASDMEALLRLYRQKGGSVLVKGKVWKYSTGLAGSLGICKPGASGYYSLKLDDTGRGLETIK